MRAINVLLSVLVSLSIAGLLLEGGLRLLGLGPTDTINRFDPDLGWSKRPDASVRRKTSEFDITISTNAEGLRDDHGPEKPPNTFRVVMLGDSFTLGFTVDRQDTFADLCERWWRSQDRRVEVINAGTEGWSTDQEVLWFIEHGVDYEPDLVLLFPYDNDIYWCGEERYQRFPKPRFRPDGTLEERELVDPGKQAWYKRFALGKLLAGRPHADPKDYFQPAGASHPIYKEFAPVLVDEPAFLADAEARTKGALRALEAKTAELGARLVVAPIPSEMVVHEEEARRFEGNVAGLAWDAERPVELFLAMARELAITTIDARQALKLAGKDERLYFEKEWHFTPAGNRRFAEFLVEELDRLEAFPGEHSAIAEGDFAAPEEEPGGGVPTWLWIYGGLLIVLGTTYTRTYTDESAPAAFAKVAGFLGLVFALILGGSRLVKLLPPSLGPKVLILFLVVILGFVAYKLGRKLGTIAELLKAFTLRGHWYLMPLVVVLLTIGSLLVVAASSPLIAPFIYTLF